METRFRKNPFFQDRMPPELVPPAPSDVLPFHRELVGYAPTPLVPLPEVAKELGLGEVWIKDESKRFGLNAFKVLGASYAIYRFLRGTSVGSDPSRPTVKMTRYTFATATDGNHGRAVAWTAKSLGHEAVVFVPKNTVPARIEAIRGEGAKVVVVDGTYDDTVTRAAAEAAKNGWQVISDTAYPGYMQVPAWIMDGYATLFHEAIDQLDAQGHKWPDHVFLQAGVGGLACAGVLFFRRRGAGKRPAMVSVEPTDADCLLESILSPDGSIRVAKGKQNSIMAGLNCGTPSLLAWPVLKSGVDFFLAVEDAFAEQAMRVLAANGVTSGESGAAGLAGLLALCKEPALAESRSALGLGSEAKILLISTEGDTDPVSYRRIVG